MRDALARLDNEGQPSIWNSTPFAFTGNDEQATANVVGLTAQVGIAVHLICEPCGMIRDKGSDGTAERRVN
jgi:hypothetical protein